MYISGPIAETLKAPAWPESTSAPLADLAHPHALSRTHVDSSHLTSDHRIDPRRHLRRVAVVPLCRQSAHSRRRRRGFVSLKVNSHVGPLVSERQT